MDETEILRREFNRFAANHDKLGKSLNTQFDELKEKNTKLFKSSEEDWTNFKLSNAKMVETVFQDHSKDTQDKLNDMLVKI